MIGTVLKQRDQGQVRMAAPAPGLTLCAADFPAGGSCAAPPLIRAGWSCCSAGAGQGPHRHHAGGRHQRFPGPVRRQRGHRRQRRRRHRPGDRRRHHRGGGSVRAGEAAGAGHGPDAADRRQLPLCHRLQRHPHRPGGCRGAGPRRLRHAPQSVHPGVSACGA